MAKMNEKATSIQFENAPIKPTLDNTHQSKPKMPEKTDVISSSTCKEMFSKLTMRLQAIPNQVQMHFNEVKKPHPWKASLEENRKFFEILAQSEIPKSDY